jgi:hypothetical protein
LSESTPGRALVVASDGPVAGPFISAIVCQPNRSR